MVVKYNWLSGCGRGFDWWIGHKYFEPGFDHGQVKYPGTRLKAKAIVD